MQPASRPQDLGPIVSQHTVDRGRRFTVGVARAVVRPDHAPLLRNSPRSRRRPPRFLQRLEGGGDLWRAGRGRGRGAGWPGGRPRSGRPAALTGYHAWHATRADLLRRLGRSVEAKQAYDAAIAATQNSAERAYLNRKRGELI
jgi:hypothetical protein